MKDFHPQTLMVCLAILTWSDSQAQTPLVATQVASPISGSDATVNGTAVAKGLTTTAWFDWGPDATYGYSTQPTNIGTASVGVRVNFPLQGLNPNSVYHYRLIATNAAGVAYGADAMLATGLKVAVWSDPYAFEPPPAPGLSNIVAIAAGHTHSLAIRTDGTVVAWGTNFGFPQYGQITVPAGLSNVVAVAGGTTHSLALKQDGTLTVWGKYLYSGLPAFVPAGLSNVVAIAGGDSHDLALKSDGSVIGWSDGSFFTQGAELVPSGLKNVVAIAAGSTHSLALQADGKVVQWGSDFSSLRLPQSWLSNAVAISTEARHSLAIKADGTVVAWGQNPEGQTNVPNGLSHVMAISAGYRQSLALKTDGTLVAWGGGTSLTNIPSGFTNIVALASGDDHCMVLGANLAPFVNSSTNTAPANKDCVVALSGHDLNSDPLSYRITLPPTNGTLYQYTAIGRGSLINSPDTPVSDPFERVLFAPEPDSFDVQHAGFSFVANDGQLDSAPGVMALTILPPPIIQHAGFLQNSNGVFALSFTGFTNVSYSIFTSIDLKNWSWLGYPTETSPGEFYFQDIGATNGLQRFYRLSSL
jgi:Regulator of chromosome condensation (RCC1) repeat